jgi:hypothetical protein
MLENATEEFINNADWLRGTKYLPLIASLRILAKEIDASPNASLFSEYGRTYRFAASLKPSEPQHIDPLEELLTRSVSA